MSRIIKETGSEIHYILSNTAKNEEMNDIIYTDGNQTFIVNGHFIQDSDGDTPTLVLQEGEDISQYLINDDKGEIFIANIQNDSNDQTQENQQVIQYVDENGKVTNATDIIYINEDGLVQKNLVQYQLTELMETDNLLTDNIKEGTKGLELDSLIKHQYQDGSVVESTATDWHQYAVVKDNNLHHYALDISQQNTTESNNPLLDVSTITGKNLLTGQVVALDSYMEKIQKKIKSISKNSITWKRPKHNLNAFLNKKFNLGLTIGGRQLVGKIVHVGSKETPNKIDEEENEDINGQNNVNVKEDNVDEEELTASVVPDSIAENFTNKNQSKLENSKNKNESEVDQVHVQAKLLSKKSDQFQQISKTLSGLMSMDNINEQLCKKSMIIKIIDKYCDTVKKITRNISFISGYMESKFVTNEKNQLEEEWTFVPDTLKTEFFDSNIKRQSQIKYPNSVGLTILTTHQKNKSLVQVILDDLKNAQCKYCDKDFKNNKHLIWHLNDVHNQCELCKLIFDDFNELSKHKKWHTETEDLKKCPLTNKDNFKTELSLKKHIATHKLEAFNCLVCPYSGASELDLKIHSQTHVNSCNICGEIFINEAKLNFHKRMHPTNECSIVKKLQTKYFACEICKRTFSRQSNLQRHVDIHKGAEQLYRCAICECSYHYISSLTRHIVQNHVQIQRQNLNSSADGTEVNTML